MTKVVNIYKEKFTVYIGRGSKWGNPYSHLAHSSAIYRVETREAAIEAYAKWIVTQSDLMGSLHELKNQTLGCFCKPLSCHGDILAKLADELE